MSVEVDDTSCERPVLGRSRLGLVGVDGLAREWGVQFPPGGGGTTRAVVRCPGEGCREHLARAPRGGPPNPGLSTQDRSSPP